MSCFMKAGMSTTDMGLDLCRVAFSMILSPGDSVLQGRWNMDCMATRTTRTVVVEVEVE